MFTYSRWALNCVACSSVATDDDDDDDNDFWYDLFTKCEVFVVVRLLTCAWEWMNSMREPQYSHSICLKQWNALESVFFFKLYVHTHACMHAHRTKQEHIYNGKWIGYKSVHSRIYTILFSFRSQTETSFRFFSKIKADKDRKKTQLGMNSEMCARKTLNSPL